jgi:hypothetical protein
MVNNPIASQLSIAVPSLVVSAYLNLIFLYFFPMFRCRSDLLLLGYPDPFKSFTDPDPYKNLTDPETCCPLIPLPLALLASKFLV